MNLGKLDIDNENFLREHKKYGFSSCTQMANTALKEFRKLKAKEMRAQWRKDAHKEYEEGKPEYIWENIDGEDFI